MLVALSVCTAQPALAAENTDSVESETVEENASDIEIQSEEYPMYYHSDGLNIDIEKETYNDTVCYMAHVITDDPDRLQTTYAEGKWGGQEPATSADARVDSILLVNGDFRNIGYGSDLGIVRNGEIVNDVTMSSIAMGLTKEGHFVSCGGISPQEVLNQGIRDTFTFGPFLIDNGERVTNSDTAVHPRTFIGEVSRDDSLLEYYIGVADGRQAGYSIGLSYEEMTDIMEEKGCSFAYNLDGGGSSTMVFEHKLLNRPSDGQERYDADFLYIK